VAEGGYCHPGHPAVRPSVRASTFIAVSAITHKLFAISIWNLGHPCTTWKGRTLLILGVAGSKIADWGGHLEKNVFCNKWKTAYLISIIFGYYVPDPWGTFSRWWPNGVLFPIHLPHYLKYVWPFSFNGGGFPISDGKFVFGVLRWLGYLHHVMLDPREHIGSNTFLKYAMYCFWPFLPMVKNHWGT